MFGRKKLTLPTVRGWEHSGVAARNSGNTSQTEGKIDSAKYQQSGNKCSASQLCSFPVAFSWRGCVALSFPLKHLKSQVRRHTSPCHSFTLFFFRTPCIIWALHFDSSLCWTGSRLVRQCFVGSTGLYGAINKCYLSNTFCAHAASYNHTPNSGLHCQDSDNPHQVNA